MWNKLKTPEKLDKLNKRHRQDRLNKLDRLNKHDELEKRDKLDRLFWWIDLDLGRKTPGMGKPAHSLVLMTGRNQE